MQDLLTVPDWNTLLNGSMQSAFVDGAPARQRTLPDGSTIDLGQATNMANCGKTTTCSDDRPDRQRDGRAALGNANNPRWKLYCLRAAQRHDPDRNDQLADLRDR